MSPIVLSCLVSGVLLSAGAQIVLKVAMMSPGIQRLLSQPEVVSPSLVVIEMMRTPALYGGLALYGLSLAVWLYVLSRVDVSLAYPFVGLGIVLTTLSGYFVLGEDVSAMRLTGCLVVAAGLVIVARS